MTYLHCVHGEQEKQLTLMDLLPPIDTALTECRFAHFIHTMPHDKPIVYLHFIGEETIGESELGTLLNLKEQVFDVTKIES